MNKLLFPLLPATDRVLREKGPVQHLEVGCRSILNYCDTPRMPDTYTLNPYRGCEFGCGYCYARYTHTFLQLPWGDFERKILVKREAERVLMETMDTRKLLGRHIAVGTATDPYQPAESRYRLTQRILGVFAQLEGLDISITTKSSLVRRDISLLKRVASRNRLRVNISLISLDEALLSDLEPKASHPLARLAALGELRSAGIRAGLFLMPILPGITDSRETLEAVIRAGRCHRAQFISANILFLRDSAREAFFSFLRKSRPDLGRNYRRLYGNGCYTPQAYRERVMKRVKALKNKYGFRERLAPTPSRHPVQRDLWEK